MIIITGETMKIAEKLSEIHQAEGKMMRLLDLRDSIVNQNFNMKGKELSQEHFKLEEKKFLDEKMTRLQDITNQITVLRNNITDDKTAINRLNVAAGVDAALCEMGLIKLELSKLMKLTQNRYALLRENTTLDVMDETGMLKRIADLEKQKAKLESKVQAFNWSTDLE